MKEVVAVYCENHTEHISIFFLEKCGIYVFI